MKGVCQWFRLGIIVAITLDVALLSGCGKNEDNRQTQKSTEVNDIQKEAAQSTGSEWIALFDGANLSSWREVKPGSWKIDNGVMAGGGGGDIWTRDTFGDFTLMCDFRIGPKGNSGIFFRTGNTEDPVQTGIEMQIIDSAGYFGDPIPAENYKHTCGAVYDLLAPSKRAEKPAGEWNNAVITCRGSMISVTLNGEPVIVDMDMDTWTTPHLNPDGTPNKFNMPLRDFPREGYIGFQDHGDPVWFRNVMIQKL